MNKQKAKAPHSANANVRPRSHAIFAPGVLCHKRNIVEEACPGNVLDKDARSLAAHDGTRFGRVEQQDALTLFTVSARPAYPWKRRTNMYGKHGQGRTFRWDQRLSNMHSPGVYS